MVSIDCLTEYEPNFSLVALGEINNATYYITDNFNKKVF